jgi:imidazolonepropionase-like amidohydrolase
VGLSALLLLSLSCGGKKQMAPSLVRLGAVEAVTVFEDVSVFTATDSGLLEHHDVVVQADRITAVQPTGGTVPEEARMVDGRGLTLLPGLIDAHVHTAGGGTGPWAPGPAMPEHNLQAMLYAGVTGAIDMGGHATMSARLRDRVRSGELLGPRLAITHGGITTSGGHPIPAMGDLLPGPAARLVSKLIPRIDSPQEAQRVVDDAIDKGSDFIKIIYDQIPNGSSQMTEEILAATIDAAHAGGRRAYVHVGTPQDVMAAVRAGADLLAHGPYEGAISPDQAAEIASAGVPVVFTLVAYERTAQIGEGAVVPIGLEEESVPSATLESCSGELSKAVLDYPVLGHMAQVTSAHRADWTTSIQNLHAAGVPIVTGSDSTFMGIWPGSSLHLELELLVEAGLSPTQALLGATSLAAPWLDAEAEFGTIAPGQLADLLLVNGDPTQDIRATRDIVMVVQAGQEIERLVPGTQ